MLARACLVASLIALALGAAPTGYFMMAQVGLRLSERAIVSGNITDGDERE